MEYPAPPNEVGNAFVAAAAALEGIAEATQSDRTAVANLTNANSTLTQEVKKINKLKGMMKDLVQEVQAIKNAMKMMNVSTGSATAGGNNGTQDNNTQQPHTFKQVQTKWCWSCRVTRGHNSDKCKYQAPGNQADATVENMMGSNPFGMNHK